MTDIFIIMFVFLVGVSTVFVVPVARGFGGTGLISSLLLSLPLLVVGIIAAGMSRRKRWALWSSIILFSLILPVSIAAICEWFLPDAWHNKITARLEDAQKYGWCGFFISFSFELLWTLLPLTWLIYFTRPGVRVQFQGKR